MNEAGATPLTELVPPPPRGRVFEREVPPGLADVTRSGRVRLDAIARWLQDVAFADVVDAGLADRGAWLVRRARMKVEAFPHFGEPISVRTFCSATGRLAAERRTSVSGGGGGVQAVAMWIHVDPETLRPLRLGEEFQAVYGESAGSRKANFRLGHPDPPADPTAAPWRFRASDTDMAGHVRVARSEPPGCSRWVGGRVRVAEPEVRLARAGTLAVDGLELFAQPQRPQRLGVHMDPHGDRLHPAAAARDAGAPLRRQAPGRAAERPHRNRLAEVREGLHLHPRPAHEPGATVGEPGVHDVGEGDILEPARNRVQAHAARPRDVRQPRRDLALEHAAPGRRRDELGEWSRPGLVHANATSKASAAAAAVRSMAASSWASDTNHASNCDAGG